MECLRANRKTLPPAAFRTGRRQSEMLWGAVWQGVVGQKVWILPDSTRQSFFRAGGSLPSGQKRSYL